MSDTEARALVDERLKVLRIEKLVSGKSQLEPLLLATGGNPKAIEITLGLIKYERRPLQQVVDDLYAARGELFDDLFTRAWALLDEAARRVLLIMTFFVYRASGSALSVTADVEKFAFDRSVERLTDLALLDGQQEDINGITHYTLHPLVRAFALARLAEHQALEVMARERWVLRYRNLVSQVGNCWRDHNRLTMLDSEHDVVDSVMDWVYEQARDHDVADLHRGIAYYLYVRGYWTRALHLNDLRGRAACRMNDTAVMISTLANRTELLGRQGNVAEVIQCCQEIERYSTIPNTPSVQWALPFAEAFAAMASNDLQSAIAAWSKYLPLTRPMSTFRVFALRWRATCYFWLGQLIEAKVGFEQAKQLAKDIGLVRSLLIHEAYLAAIDSAYGDINHAYQVLRDCRDVALAREDRTALAEVERFLSQVYAARGEHSAARIALQDAINLFERLGMRRELAESRRELQRINMGAAPIDLSLPERTVSDETSAP
jgi:tetratricopeptide (TPR) repeat protein